MGMRTNDRAIRGGEVGAVARSLGRMVRDGTCGRAYARIDAGCAHMPYRDRRL